MKKDPRVYLAHILESAAKIERYTALLSRVNFSHKIARDFFE